MFCCKKVAYQVLGLFLMPFINASDSPWGKLPESTLLPADISHSQPRIACIAANKNRVERFNIDLLSCEMCVGFRLALSTTRTLSLLVRELRLGITKQSLSDKISVWSSHSGMMSRSEWSSGYP